MKFFYCLLLIFCGFNASSQNPIETKKSDPAKKYSNAASFGIAIPTGMFNSSHSIGISAAYSYSNNKFGNFNSVPVKKIGFTANTGITYLFGKKETVSNFRYKYPGYAFLHAFGGIRYSPVKSGNLNFTAGTAVGFYNSLTAFFIGSKLEADYFVAKRIAISPGISMMKKSSTNPLWFVSLKSNIVF
jgi:hypothetical protein